MSNPTRLTGTLRFSKESGYIEVVRGTNDEWWFSAVTDTQGSYAAFDIAEAQLRGLLAFIDAVREGETAA